MDNFKLSIKYLPTKKSSSQIGTNINKYQISSDIQIKGNLTEEQFTELEEILEQCMEGHGSAGKERSMKK